MSNKEISSFKGVVKSDSTVEQMVYFVRELQRMSRVSIKKRLFEGSTCLKGGSMVKSIVESDLTIEQTKGVLYLRALEKKSSLIKRKLFEGSI